MMTSSFLELGRKPCYALDTARPRYCVLTSSRSFGHGIASCVRAGQRVCEETASPLRGDVADGDGVGDVADGDGVLRRGA